MFYIRIFFLIHKQGKITEPLHFEKKKKKNTTNGLTFKLKIYNETMLKCK